MRVLAPVLLRSLLRSLVVIGIACTIALTLAIDDAAAATCTNQYAVGASIPNGYAVPWNVLTQTRELLVQTTSCTETKATIAVGSNATPYTQYTYTKGYWWNGTTWQQLTLGGTQVNSDWISGIGNVQVDLSGDTTFVVGYTCQLVGSSWKCGCRDTACATPYWQLQGVQKTVPAAPSTPTGGTSGTKGMITLSFDDGWRSQYAAAAPILEKYNMRGTFYVTTVYLTGNYSGFMRSNEVLDLQSRGHEIGSHTVNHKNLTQITRQEVQTELRESKRALESLLGKEVPSFAYTYGAYNADTIALVKEAGYKNARNTFQGYITRNTDRYQLHSTTPVIASSMSNMKALVDRAIKDDTWFVFSFHQIDQTGVEYSNTPAFLEELVAYLAQKGVPVVTIEEGIRRVYGIQ